MDWVDEHHHLWDCFPFDSFSFESSFHLPLSWCRVDPWCCHPSHLWPENLSLRSSPLPTNDRRREPGKDGLRRKRWIEPLSICCEVGRVDFRRQGHQICASVWGKPIFGSVAGRGVEEGRRLRGSEPQCNASKIYVNCPFQNLPRANCLAVGLSTPVIIHSRDGVSY